MKESPRRSRLSDPPAFQQEHFGAILMPQSFCCCIIDCIAATTKVFNSFLPTVPLCRSLLSSVPKAFSRVLFIKGSAIMVHMLRTLSSHHSAAAGVLFQLSQNLFRDGLHVGSVATASFFDIMKSFLSKKEFARTCHDVRNQQMLAHAFICCPL